MPTTNLSTAKTVPERHISALLEIGSALTAAFSARAAFQCVLEGLEHHQDILRGMISVLDRNSGEIRVESSLGFGEGGRGAYYRLGEGITGRVVETGKAIIVPEVSREPMFLNRVGQRKNLTKNEVTFVCVPFFVNNRPVGALGVDLRFERDREYEADLNILRIVASMMAQSVKADYLLDEERQRLLDENTNLRGELTERYEFSNIIGTAGPMKHVYEQIVQVARTNTTVLIRGESGTGKELIAHALHYNSPRAKKPFVKVSCAALPETLIESELFGYEKGAFTGANARKKGRFEMAEGGTLFLDEIGEVSLATQVKLLRVIQEKAFEPIGSTETLQANVRLVAATNKDLDKAIGEGKFREDLYYRLNVFNIFVPPLRERKSDLLLLSDHFLQKYAKEHGKDIRRISTPAIDMLTSYHWPGNVRELENVIERAVLMCNAAVIHAHNLPPTLQTAQASGTITPLSLGEAMAAYEKDLIQDALKTARGNKSKAARLLSTTDRILNYTIRKYGIDITRFRG